MQRNYLGYNFKISLQIKFFCYNSIKKVKKVFKKLAKSNTIEKCQAVCLVTDMSELGHEHLYKSVRLLFVQRRQ
jgi:hypothetical protein